MNNVFESAMLYMLIAHRKIAFSEKKYIFEPKKINIFFLAAKIQFFCDKKFFFAAKRS